MANISNSIVQDMTRSEELSKQLRDRDEHIKRLTAEVREYINAEKVLIAAGLVSEEKVKQAHDIVQSF
jgi:hypothetical protein